MAQGIAGTCVVCDLPVEKRLEVEARLIRGDSLESVGEIAGYNLMTVRAHMDNGHIAPDIRTLRGWMQKHGPGPIEKQLEKARTTALAQVDDTPDLTPKDLQRRLLFLERYAMQVLQRIENSSDPNDRTALQGVESVRRLCMDLFTLTKGDKSLDVVETTDVTLLRDEILELAGRKPTPRNRY